MAEEILAGNALFMTINVVENFCKLVETLREFGEAKVDQIYHQLIAEKAKFEGWANSRRNEFGPYLRSDTSNENWSRVENLACKLGLYIIQAQEKYGGRLAAEKGRPIAAVKARLFFSSGGYQSLVLLMDTLKAMNETLLAIAPILPRFSPLTNTDTESVTLRPAQLVSTTDPEPPPFNAVAPSADPTSQSIVRHSYFPSLSTIFNLSLDALYKIARQRDHEALHNASARLKLWGASLFGDPVTLDQIFDSSEVGTDVLRKGMLKVFTNILVVEGEQSDIV